MRTLLGASLGLCLLLLFTSTSFAYQRDCIATTAVPTYTENESVPCTLRLDGGMGMHFLDLLGGEHLGVTEDDGYLRVVGGTARAKTIMTNVTMNTTSAATTIFSGGKTPIAQVSGTGAVTATVSLFGDNDSTTTDGVELCRITLSGTTKHVKGCDINSQLTTDYPFYYATTTNVTGAGATVEFVVESGIVGTRTGPSGAVALWTCNLNGIGATLTECQPAPGAGLKLYITDITTISTTATAGQHTLRFGTGTNCGTGTGNLFFGLATVSMNSPGNTTNAAFQRLVTPIAVTANNAVCVLGVVTNTTNAQISGYTAP